MPKISVHLEADSAEEFQALLAAFQLQATPPAPAQGDDLTRMYEGVSRIAAKIIAEEPAGTRTTEEAPDPVTVRVPEPEVEQPVAAAPQEPAQPRRGRPRKEKAEKPVGPAAEPAVGVVLPVPGVVHEGGQTEEAAPKAEAAPAPVKPKIMPHAKPENGAATRQDLLDAFSEYVQRYGASFGFSDISQLLQKNLGDGVRKASDVPEDKLPVAIGAIKTAIADNPFNRKRDYA